MSQNQCWGAGAARSRIILVELNHFSGAGAIARCGSGSKPDVHVCGLSKISQTVPVPETVSYFSYPISRQIKLGEEIALILIVC
jgi:hypothetical protein